MPISMQFISIVSSISYAIAHVFIAFGASYAGWAYYKKVYNDKRLAVYNRAFDVYRNYSNVISIYIHLTDNDEPIDNHYRETHLNLYSMSKVCLLIARDHLESIKFYQ